MLENRVWGSETFNDYYHDKIIKENKVPIAGEEMIDYIIEGIPVRALRN